MTAMPDARGRFGDFGGRFVPETVMGALDELAAGYETARADPAFAPVGLVIPASLPVRT